MTLGPDFRQTYLWRQAFETPRSDAVPDEQEYFRTQYLVLREKAALLVNRIAADLPGMTVHDVTHLDALWDTASLVANGAVSVNPAEAFVLGASILLHDAAMSLAAYPNGLADVRRTVAWQDASARLSLAQEEAGGEAFDVVNPPKDVEDRLLPEVLRRLHAEQAEKLAEQAWSANGEQVYLIDDPELRHFYGPTIGQIAHSHWWSVQKVELTLAGDLGALPQRTHNIVDKIKLACLLRIADALHLDSRRAPRFIRTITSPVGISALHWAFQERVARPHLELDAVVFTAGQPFGREDADAWWLAFDTLNAVDRELNDVDQLLQSRGKEVLKARRVKGAGSPEMMARTLNTKGWRPVDARLRVSDVPRIVEDLGGAKLYGDDPTVALRELIQNAADAVQARRRFEDRDRDYGLIGVGLEQRDDDTWLLVEDNGIGMSELVLTGPLLDFGTSFWRSSLALDEFPGLMAAGMTAIGRFGIGFFSVFMLGSEVRVYSRRCDRGVGHGRLLEFREGLASRPILSPAQPKDLPRDGGTRIEVKLKQQPASKGGLLARSPYTGAPLDLGRVLAAVAPNLDVALCLRGEKSRPLVEPGDWLLMSGERLLARLDLPFHQREEKKEDVKSRMGKLIGPDGEVYGRAAIWPTSLYSIGLYSFLEPPGAGWVTIGGLRANPLRNVRGLLLGKAVTAARDAATPLVDAETLASWASEQARLVCEMVRDEEIQARCAEVVLECGGVIAELKIVRWGADWLNADEFRQRLREVDKFDVSFDGEFTYDEDTDNVMPREFRHEFEQQDDVAIVLRHDGSILRGSGLLWPNSLTSRSACSDSQVAAHVRAIIAGVWGQDIEPETETRTVGKVGRTDIDRDVSRFRQQDGLD
jgi:Histidine kinase-, DNA gyrase B-, and HSP90-like ATPase